MVLYVPLTLTKFRQCANTNMLTIIKVYMHRDFFEFHKYKTLSFRRKKKILIVKIRNRINNVIDIFLFYSVPHKEIFHMK